MISTLPIPHRQGAQPGRVRAHRGLAALGCARRDRRVGVLANDAPYAVSTFAGAILPAMWTKCSARPLGTRST
jgi:hypothetical protein